ncbi:MAG TPA: hypothetical protein VLR50_12190 [Desulfobacterales bacterium]|nr:hypothetical protein [Desulfobacterales bacterium]
MEQTHFSRPARPLHEYRADASNPTASFSISAISRSLFCLEIFSITVTGSVTAAC